MTIAMTGLRLLLAAASVVPSLLPFGFAIESDWPTFRGNAERSGNTDGSELPRQLEKHWVFRGEGYVSPRVDSSPAVAHGAVYVGVAEQSVFSPSGRVICLDAASGKRRWEHKTRLPVFSSPAVSAGRVFVGEGYHQDAECHLYCLDAKTGKRLWTFATSSHIESSPQVDKHRVYFGAGDDGIYCLNAEDGTSVWHFPGEHVDVSPWVFSGFLFAGAGYGKHEAFCLSATDGTVRWRATADLPLRGSPLLLGNRLYFGVGNGNFLESGRPPQGGVTCLAATTGKPLWYVPFPDAVLTAVAHCDGKIFFGSRDGHLYAASPATGAILWKRSLGSAVVASPVVGNKRVAAVSVAGKLVIASVDTGEELASVDLARLIDQDEATVLSSPAVTNGRLIVGTSAGAVVCLGEKP